MSNVIDFTKRIMESKEESVERGFGVETFYRDSSEINVNNILFGTFNPAVMEELSKGQIQELIIKLTEALAIL